MRVTPVALALTASLLVAPSAPAHTQARAQATVTDRVTVRDRQGDAGDPDIDVSRFRVTATSSEVRFQVVLPRRLGPGEPIQGLVVLMHDRRHEYYVTGNRTAGSVVFAVRRTGDRTYHERSRGTSRTFTRRGVLTLVVPVGSFRGARLHLDKIYAHLGPIGTGHTEKDHVTPPSRALRLR